MPATMGASTGVPEVRAQFFGVGLKRRIAHSRPGPTIDPVSQTSFPADGRNGREPDTAARLRNAFTEGPGGKGRTVPGPAKVSPFPQHGRLASEYRGKIRDSL